MIIHEMFVIGGIGNYFPLMLMRLDGQQTDNQIFPKFSSTSIICLNTNYII